MPGRVNVGFLLVWLEFERMRERESVSMSDSFIVRAMQYGPVLLQENRRPFHASALRFTLNCELVSGDAKLFMKGVFSLSAR